MKNIYKALASFQQECPVIHKGTKGFSYSYADLPSIFEVINPLLQKNGLGFTQLIMENSIKSILFHIESGETLESIINIPSSNGLKGMNEFQVLGSAITYLRRYALSAMLGIVTDKDTDANNTPTQKETFEQRIKRFEQKIKTAKTVAELTTIYNEDLELFQNAEMMQLLQLRKKQIEK